MTKSENSLLSGSVLKGMMRFAYPVFLANLLQTLYSTVDLFIVGRYATTADISGVSVGGMVIGLVVMALMGFSNAVTVIIGNRTGANDAKGLAESTGTAIALYIVFAVVLTLPMAIFDDFFIRLMNTPAESALQARQYLFWCALGMPFVVGYSLTGALLRGRGNSKAPFIFVAISTVFNIVADYVLIKMFGMGARGAAIATAAAQGVALLSSIIYLKVKGLGFAFSLTDVRFNKNSIKEIFRIGTPLSLQDLLIHVSFTIITAAVNEMGLSVSASAGVAERIITIIFMPASSISTAIATMTAHNIGAGQFDRAKKSMRTGMAACTSIGVVMYALTLIFGRWMSACFTTDPDVVKNSYLYLTTYAFDVVCIGLLFPMNGYLTSGGHSFFTMLHTLATSVCIRMPLTLILAKIPGITLMEIGIGSPLSTFVSVIICVIFLKYLKKHPEKEIIIGK